MSGRNVITVGEKEDKVIWRQIDNSFFTIKSNASSIIKTQSVDEDNIKAIVELKKALESNGVQLIVSVIQDSEPIVARIINKEFRDVVDYQMYNNIRMLLEYGIEAVTPSFDSVIRCNEEEFTYNIGLDNHPSVLIQKIVSEILSKRLQRYNIPKRLDKNNFTFEDVDHYFYGIDPIKTWPDNCDIGNHKPGERIKVKKPVIGRDCSYINRSSEILVIGNSFTASPYPSPHASADREQACGLVSWLDYNLETDVDYYYYTQNGPATVFIKNLLADPAKYLKGKKVVIVDFGLIHLLNTQWNNISELDRQLILLSSSKPISTIRINGNISNANMQDKELNETVFNVSNESIEIAKTSIETINKNTLIVVSARRLSGNIYVRVNDDIKHLPSSPSGTSNSYQSLIFEIPANTKELSISVFGKYNSTFAIKDIQIWQ